MPGSGRIRFPVALVRSGQRSERRDRSGYQDQLCISPSHLGTSDTARYWDVLCRGKGAAAYAVLGSGEDAVDIAK